MTIKRLIIVLTLTAPLAFGIGSSLAHSQTGDSSDLVETWLLKNCDAGEEQELQNEIVQKGVSLEPEFLEAYNNGPDPKLIEQVEAAAGRNYDKRAKMLEAGETFGLSAEDLQVVKSESREDYINGEKEAFVLRYKSQALSGLGLVGDEGGYQILKEVSGDPDSPLQITAQEALKNIKYEEPEKTE